MLGLWLGLSLAAATCASSEVRVALTLPAALTPELGERLELADRRIRALLGPDASAEAAATWTYRASGWAVAVPERESRLQALRRDWPGELRVVEFPDASSAAEAVDPAWSALAKAPTPSSLGRAFDASAATPALETPGGLARGALAPPPAAPSRRAVWLQRALVASLLTYSTAVGAREGYTWAGPERRRDNALIQGRLGDGKGILDYHAWRTVEQAGIAGAIASTYFLAREKPETFKVVKKLVGAALVGYFVYERALNHVVTGELFPKKGDYHVMGLTVPRSQAFDVAAGLTGLYLLQDF